MPPSTAPAKLSFVSNLFTSKIFLAQVAGLVAVIAGAAGVHVLDDPTAQTELVAVLSFVGTILLRWLAPTGPVSVSAPIITPPAQDVPLGRSTVEIATPAAAPATVAVTPAPFVASRSAL
jgi:hypothetical protein